MPELVLNCPLCGSPESEHFDTRTFREFTVSNRLCENCGFVYQSPRMDEEELENFYQREYRRVYQGDEGPTAKDRFVQAGRAQWFSEILDRRGVHPGRVLDIGSSAGLLLNHLKQNYACDVIGIEPGEVYRNFARSQGLTIFESLEDMQGEDPQPFDLITIAHVLEHIPYPVAYLDELKQLLTDDGLLLVEVPNLYAHDSFEIAHTSAFSSHTLNEVLRLGGYRIIHQWKHGEPRSEVLPLYLTILAKPVDQQAPRIRPERFVALKRRLGMLRRKIIQKVMPARAWVRIPSETSED